MRLAHCTAWPAAPLPRLSSALTTMTGPSLVTVAWRRHALAPTVAAVGGHTPSGSTRTNGSPA